MECCAVLDLTGGVTAREDNGHVSSVQLLAQFKTAFAVGTSLPSGDAKNLLARFAFRQDLAGRGPPVGSMMNVNLYDGS
jgi:hypothetical protein